MDQASLAAFRQSAGNLGALREGASGDPELRSKAEYMGGTIKRNLNSFEQEDLAKFILDWHETGKIPQRNTTQGYSKAVHALSKPRLDQPPSEEPFNFSLLQTAKNIPSSTYNLVKNVGSLVAHPLQTGKALFQVGVGGAANTLESIASLAGVKNPEDIFDLETEDMASAVGDFYVQRYGSLEKAAQTLQNDPAGFLSDLGAIVSGVGGVVKGGAIAAGELTGAATRSSTALTRLGRGLRAAEQVGTKLVKTGINMEPLVIAGKGVIMAGRGAGNATVAGLRGLRPGVMATKGLKINPNDIRGFMNLPGSEMPGDFLLRKGVLSGGDIAVGAEGVEMTGMSPLGRTRMGIMGDLERLAEKSKSTVDATLSGVKQTYDVLDDVPVEVPKLLDEIMTIANKYDLAEQKALVQSFLEKERVTLTELNNLKRTAYDLFNTYKRSNIADDSFRAKQIIGYEKGLRKFIEDEAMKKGLPDIGILNNDTQKARDILDAMHNADAASWSKGKLTFGLMDTLFGIGAYGITGDFMSSAGIIMGRKVFESTVFKTTFAKYLNRLDPTQIKILQKALKSARHTNESKRILTKVVSQTADDIESNRIGEAENITAATAPRPTQLSSPVSTELQTRSVSSDGIIPNKVPKAMPREGATKGLTGGSDSVGGDTLYHGTAKGNIFDKFENGKVGVGNNINHQGDVVYLTDSKKAADYFSTQATRNAKLRDRSLPLDQATGGADQLGEVMRVKLSKDAKVKDLSYRPTKAEVDAMRSEGWDAVSFPEEAFNAKDLAGTDVSGLQSRTIAVLNKEKISTLPSVGGRKAMPPSGGAKSFIERNNFIPKTIENVIAYHAEVKAMEPEFLRETASMAKKLGAQYTSRVKEASSILRKSTQDSGRTLSSIGDSLGSSIIVKDPIKALKDLSPMGKVDNFYENPTYLGYRGIHIDHRLSNGMKSEIQIHKTKEGLMRKEWAHTIYDKYRKYIKNEEGLTLEDATKMVPEKLREAFIADVKKSNEIYNGKLPIPKKFVDMVNKLLKTPN